MKFKIGFHEDVFDPADEGQVYPEEPRTVAPRRSVVQVLFPGRGSALAYYNDRFDLRSGDRVYVDGKLEGQMGRVIAVNYNFKIKLSDYKRVIALVDTDVKGRFRQTDSHFVTFDPHVLPAAKVRSWFKAPVGDEDEYVSGGDDSSFLLDDPEGMKIGTLIAERGEDYWLDRRVRYISVYGTQGYAIVEGSEAYEVEFEYWDGEIRNLTCSCFCNYRCKHEFAAMLQLKAILAFIEKHASSEYRASGCFAAVYQGTLFEFAVAGKAGGVLSLG